METMTTLQVSPQGQITIPKDWRKLLDLSKNTKMIAHLTDASKGKQMVLKSEPKSWVKAVAGTGKGLWGNSDQYLQKERNSWDKK